MKLPYLWPIVIAVTIGFVLLLIGFAVVHQKLGMAFSIPYVVLMVFLWLALEIGTGLLFYNCADFVPDERD